ncbi:GntR family transcriptional regulator [Chloroflexota bacterium]
MEDELRGVQVRLSDKAYQLIRHKIITLELPPLSAIDEQALMEELQLGRTPIREALQRLAAEDLVMLAPRRGMFVADISLTDLQRIFEVRMVLEGFCAQLAAQRATPEQLSKMAVVMQEMDQVPNGDNRALMAIDERFHGLLYEAADNEFVADTLKRLHALSFRLWHVVLDRLGDVEGAMKQHRAITDALTARDEVRAAELIQRHVSEFQREIKAVL